MMWWCSIVFLFCVHSVMSQDVLCLFSSDTILLDRNGITQVNLEREFERLLNKDGREAKACHLVLTIFTTFVRVQFTSNIRAIGRLIAQEPSLSAITSINYTRSNYIQTQLIYVCDATSTRFGDYCNRDYYFQLSSGELFWIFNKNYTEIQLLLQPILYEEKNETNQTLNCFEQDKVNALACTKSICFARQINDETNNTEISCGMPKSSSIDEHIRSFLQVNIETRLCSNGETYFEFSYTCNTNQCNGQDTIDKVREIISQHYNISNLQLPSNLYKPAVSTSYCQMRIQNSNHSMILSTFR